LNKIFQLAVEASSIEIIDTAQDFESAAILWLLDGKSFPENDLQRFSSRLSPSEIRRWVHFARSVRRRQFLLGRVLLRYAVTAVTGHASRDFSVLERSGEAPQLLFNDPSYCAPNFSLSHSGDWIACVVSTAAVVGVDIEMNRPDRGFDDISTLAFPEREQSWFGARPHSERCAAFYLLWCFREASYKLQCNLRSSAEALRLPHDDSYARFCRPGIYAYQIPVDDLGLTAVVVSNEALSGIRKVVLTQPATISDLIP
jgi:4'-phosphopantetheinyl transferase